MYEIERFLPCKEAIEFRSKFDSFEEAWQACPRGDWMLWLALRLYVDKRLSTLVKGRCAETIIHLMKDERSKNAVKAAILYGEGKVTDEELRYAAYAAADAADAAAYVASAAAYAANAASAAANAASAASAADAAAAAAAYTAAYATSTADASSAAAYATAYAAASAAADAARKENQMETANICRELLTDAVMEQIFKRKIISKER